MVVTNKSGFTVIELLVGLVIISSIMGLALVMMTMGSKNVQKGSFNALASNQAYWISTLIREDIARADKENIKFPSADSNIWDGVGNFEIQLTENEKVSYNLKSKGKNYSFVRKVSKGSSRAQQVFGDEYLTGIKIEKKDDNGSVYYMIDITMTNSSKSVGTNNQITWKTNVYTKPDEIMAKYWVSTEQLTASN